MTQTKRGVLVLADISGFTAFVTATELEHGPPIIATLLEEVVARLAPPLEVMEIEGDAVFALGVHGTVVPPASLLDVIHDAFAGFRERRRELERDDSCSCAACRNVWRLRLKVIAHYGAFVVQRVAGRLQAAGREVILAHRLLKNRLARTGDYALLTRPAVAYMGVDPAQAALVPHTERYEHFGAVECFVGDLEPAAFPEPVMSVAT
ncbi:MAG TPA: DUF2652 domain-containing protein [Candidatus Tectomicrobia bacterium]|nr:DUF2652 domain-containing protein [Candidatus Tectomicrobia bacterium]